jgi:hypothetical protein
MRGQANKIGRRLAHGLLGAAMMVALGGCDWLFGSSTPSNAEKARPGAERQVAPSNSVPSAGAGRQYDTAITPVDETRTGPKIGSIIPDKGGQKAQLDAAAKDAAERDKKAREEREKAALDEADRKAKSASTDAKGAKGAQPPADEPPTQPAAPPQAPVTTAPAPPPPASPPADQKS